MDVITVSNGSNKYPGDFTNKEILIIKKYAKGRIINLFSGSSTIGDFRIDFAHSNATENSDVFDWLENLGIGFKIYHQQSVIIDAPYNKRFADKYNALNQFQTLDNSLEQFIIFANSKKTTLLFELIRKKIDPNIIILKSWNYYILPDYTLKKGYICYAGGYRKSTFLLILEKRAMETI